MVDGGWSMEGQTVLITGAGRGLGLAIARKLASRRPRLVLHHFQTPLTDMLKHAAELQLAGALGVQVVHADFTSPSQIQRMFEDLGERGWRAIDVLVNNAGVMLKKPLADTRPEEWATVLAINVIAASQCIRHAARMGCRKVINLADIAAEKGWKNYSAYVASKGALVAMTRSLAVELAPDVQVNAISPGLVSVTAGNEGVLPKVLRKIPAGRAGTRDEVAACVELLLDAPDYVTGQVLAVDGGLGLR
jgi:NAD(P)-dependent dehydrogenase (short-subunit alcohol dehydrogenase family)